jgi:hypothetical protein
MCSATKLQDKTDITIMKGREVAGNQTNNRSFSLVHTATIRSE